jgi:hypothetical protein
MNVYIDQEELRPLAEKIVESVKKVTGYDEEVTLIEKDKVNYNWGTIGSTTTQGSTWTSVAPSITSTTTTGNMSGTITFPYNQSTAGSQYWSTYPTVIQPTIGPVNVETPPAKEHFEKMVSAQIQVLNEAYSLGREHGKLEGLKEGSEQITRTLDDIMDTDILEHEGDDSLSLAV